MAADFIIGPVYGWIGDPTTAAGADMVQLPEIATLSIDFGTGHSFATSPFTGGAPEADGVYSMPPEPVATITFNQIGIDELLPLISGSEKYTATTNDALGIGGAITKVALPTVVFIPAFAAEAVPSAPHTAAVQFWFPAGFFSEFSGIDYGPMQRNASSNSTPRATLRAARRKTDQDGQTIPQNARFMFYGKPAALGLAQAWTLPALVV